MTMLPDVESLRLLVLVGETGSLTAAAAKVGISQPSASKRISVLERRLGVQLLDRTRSGSSLTRTGVTVAGSARRVLGELAALVDGVAAVRARRDTRLSLAASLTVAEQLLPAWLATLRERPEDLHVDLQVVNSQRVCALVAGGEVDLGFVESPGPFPGLHTRVVGRDRLLLVVAPDHPWASRTEPVGAALIAASALVSREDGSGTRQTVEGALRAAGAAATVPALELGSSTAVRSAVAAGAGPALLSEHAVAADLAAGTLTAVPTTGVDLSRRLRAVWRGAARPSGPAADLIGVALRGR